MIVVVEVEGPTRLYATARTEAERQRLVGWIEASAAREAAVNGALSDEAAHGGRERGEGWARELRGDPGGVVRAVEELLADRLRPDRA